MTSPTPLQYGAWCQSSLRSWCVVRSKGRRCPTLRGAISPVRTSVNQPGGFFPHQPVAVHDSDSATLGAEVRSFWSHNSPLSWETGMCDMHYKCVFVNQLTSRYSASYGYCGVGLSLHFVTLLRLLIVSKVNFQTISLRYANLRPSAS